MPNSILAIPTNPDHWNLCKVLSSHTFLWGLPVKGGYCHDPSRHVSYNSKIPESSANPTRNNGFPALTRLPFPLRDSRGFRYGVTDPVVQMSTCSGNLLSIRASTFPYPLRSAAEIYHTHSLPCRFSIGSHDKCIACTIGKPAPLIVVSINTPINVLVRQI